MYLTNKNTGTKLTTNNKRVKNQNKKLEKSGLKLEYRNRSTNALTHT